MLHNSITPLKDLLASYSVLLLSLTAPPAAWLPRHLSTAQEGQDQCAPEQPNAQACIGRHTASFTSSSHGTSRYTNTVCVACYIPTQSLKDDDLFCRMMVCGCAAPEVPMGDS